jgi:SNF2 family DNA or RNA helicase
MNQYDIGIDEIDEHVELAQQPAAAKIKLWAHQLALLQRCKDYENNNIPLTQFPHLCRMNANLTSTDFLRTQIGIIGDRVGSGKSYVILSLLLDNDITQKENCIKAYGTNRVILSFKERNINLKTNLLVIPHNLTIQWENYINTFTDSLKYLMISKEKTVDYIISKPNEVSSFDLLVVTSSYFTRIAKFLTSRSFKMQRVIFDEVDNMNLPNCMTIESNFYWFITASYGNLLYPRGYTRWDFSQERQIWYAHGLRNSGFIKETFLDLSEHLSRDFTKILVLKNNEDFIKSSVHVPEMNVHVYKCKTPLTINVLHGYVDKDIIESLNAGDIQSAMSRLNPNNKTSEENLISIQIEKFAKEVKNIEIRLEAVRSMSYDNEELREGELQRLNKKKDEYMNKINGIRDRIKSAEMCNICFDDISNKTITPCCSNGSCFLCLNIWLSKSRQCPFCKRALSNSELLVVNEECEHMDCNVDMEQQGPITKEQVDASKDKLANLEALLLQLLGTTGENLSENPKKIIIYSSYDMSFTNIINILKKNEFRYASIKGPVDHIRKTLQRYKEEDVNVLLLNSRLYGSGMNLEFTTDVIMFHKVDSEIEKQIIGRAQRYPRTNALNVHYFLYDNEIHS